MRNAGNVNRELNTSCETK